MLTLIRVFLLLALTSGPSLFGADFAMRVTDKNYLDTQGFSVFLYDSTYHPVFVDQKNTAMEMILHGQRIATNGDVRLMPTPEQWDLVATLKGREADKTNNRLTANLAFPTFDLSYTLEVAAEPGGVRVSINLDKPLPQKLSGRAGFNLEFLPSIYMGKTYLVDGIKAGIFPRTPNDPMVKVLTLPDEPKKAYYLEDWEKAKGYTQPLPFAEGRSITLGVDDALARINVKSDTADLMLFDGRNRAQNGWFVLRSLIPSGKTTGAIVWHIRPDVIPNWTRPPMIAHSQVGYAPGFSKVAVLELDPKYNGPKTAKVLRLMEDGSYQQAFEGPITPSTPWLRYVYSRFDFTPVKDPGLYVIQYADQRTAPFPISKDAYANIWQGHQDFVLQGNRDFAQLLDDRGITHAYRETEGAHVWSVWRHNLNDAAPLLFVKTSADQGSDLPSASQQRENQRRIYQEQLANDWPNLARYHEANQNLPSSEKGKYRVVFMGDSITDIWAQDSASFFPGKDYIGRGIGGQTTPQMVLRFQQDVIALKPAVVVINGGTNDIAGNTGPSTLKMIEDNLKSMTELAVNNKIKVVLASVTPVYDYPWKPGLQPAEKIVALNAWMKDYCAQGNCVFADYFSAMSDDHHGMREGLSKDGVHPTQLGYTIMNPIAEKAIGEALHQ